MTVFKTIQKHSVKYLTGSMFSAIITFLMMKYYTTVFSPDLFGILALYLIMFEYVKALVSLNMDYGTMRLYFEYKESQRDEYLSTMFWFISGLAFLVVIFSLLFMDKISSWIAPHSENIFLVTIFTAILAVFVRFLMRILLNEQHSSSVMKHTIFQTTVNHLSSFLLITFMNLGIFGRMSGQGLGYLLNSATLLREFSANNLLKIKFVFNRRMAKETFILSIPMMVLYLQNIIFLYMDRIFLKYYMGDSAVGIYSLGYMLGQGLSMIYDAITQAILPKYYKDMDENYENARNDLERFSLWYYAGLVILTMLLSLLSPMIVDLISNENYSEAASVMPYVMAGFMMGGLYKIPSIVLGFHKIVWFYPLLAFISFGSNALLNWLLIPINGMVGAAFASFLGIFIYSIGMQFMARSYMRNRYNMRVVFVYIIIISFIVGSFYG